MAEPELTPVERRIADQLANAMDNMARIMVNPVSSGRVAAKLWVAARHIAEVMRAMDTSLAVPYKPGDVEWDIERVWRHVAAKNQRGSALDQIWSALQHDYSGYVATNPFPRNPAQD